MLLLPLILAAALTTPATPTPGYAEALARAERYEKQFSEFRIKTLFGMLGPHIPELVNRCSPGPRPTKREFKLILSYADGRFAKVETDNADPAAACFQAALAELTYPAPPVPDFAEEMTMVLEADDARPPGAPDKH
ncbi:hypothetical protein QO010_003447 [Caulobacter ginsengisoli]|uniref:TonB C-terminal domain-containing protein n=1 Tax=Caulobacter ginsengisoli TaxID=400775 RepID=A0ABU0IWV5_9CAUL|nr:hypothetical protein [Caulobacter ginsengisoli]MDQ0465658.1 hypothetical protein [Caulobacter ginsengisoli]